MSLIDFPNVPLAPGVPDVRRSAIGIGAVSGVLGAIAGVDYFGLLDGVLGPEWGIYDKDGNMVIVPDSVIAFDYRGEQRISKYPVELGSFSSYNKVALPYDIRVVMSCSGSQGSQLSDLTNALSGNGAVTRDAFLTTLELMKESTDLYDFATPDFTYQNVNLVRFDYRRTSNQGVTLLVVDAQFEEVRQTAVAVYSATAQPQGETPVSTGSVQPVEPTVDQRSYYDKKIERLKEITPNVTVIRGG